jgi:hypothetical protein
LFGGDTVADLQSARLIETLIGRDKSKVKP